MISDTTVKKIDDKFTRGRYRLSRPLYKQYNDRRNDSTLCENIISAINRKVDLDADYVTIVNHHISQGTAPKAAELMKEYT